MKQNSVRADLPCYQSKHVTRKVQQPGDVDLSKRTGYCIMLTTVTYDDNASDIHRCSTRASVDADMLVLCGTLRLGAGLQTSTRCFYKPVLTIARSNVSNCSALFFGIA